MSFENRFVRMRRDHSRWSDPLKCLRFRESFAAIPAESLSGAWRREVASQLLFVRGCGKSHDRGHVLEEATLGTSDQSDQLELFCAVVIRSAIVELVLEFEERTGFEVLVKFDLNPIVKNELTWVSVSMLLLSIPK